MSTAWKFDCEDDLEASGLTTVCVRAGIGVTSFDRGGRLRVVADPAHAAAARDLQARITASYVRQLERAHRKALDRRERIGRLVLLTGLAALTAIAVLLWP